MNRDQRLEMLITGRVEPPTEPQLDPLIPLPRVARVYGVTLRTIDRWLQRPEIGFPRPEYINGRRYLRLSTVVAFDEARAAAAERSEDEAPAGEHDHG